MCWSCQNQPQKKQLQSRSGTTLQIQVHARQHVTFCVCGASKQGAAQNFDRMFRKLLAPLHRGASDASSVRTPTAESPHVEDPAAASTDDDPAAAEAEVGPVGNEQLWLEFISSLTSVLVRHLPAFWQLPQVRSLYQNLCCSVLCL